MSHIEPITAHLLMELSRRQTEESLIALCDEFPKARPGVCYALVVALFNIRADEIGWCAETRQGFLSNLREDEAPPSDAPESCDRFNPDNPGYNPSLYTHSTLPEEA